MIRGDDDVGISSDSEWESDEMKYLWMIREDDDYDGMPSDREWESDEIQS